MDPIIFKSAIVLGGGALGFLYYKFIGCRTGACPLTSSPIMSVIMGATLALMFVVKR